jgi:hypothetical protein
MDINEVANELEKIFQKYHLIASPIKKEGLKKIEILLDLPIFSYTTSQNMQELVFTLNLLYNQVTGGDLKLIPITFKKIYELIEYEFAGMGD